MSCGLHDDEVAIHVRDTGIGIAEGKLPYIFAALRQGRRRKLNRPYEGAGLGLTIEQRLVQQMHGRITVEERFTRRGIDMYRLAAGRPEMRDDPTGQDPDRRGG